LPPIESATLLGADPPRSNANYQPTILVKIAVIGHVEWVDFARVDSLPAPGEIVQASETWAEAAGAGAVSSVQLANLGAETSFFTTVGDDELGRRCRQELEDRGIRVHAAAVGPARRAFTHIDQTGERTITVLGEKYRPGGDDESFPWHELQDYDGVYFVSGDVKALRRARQARVLVAAARDLGTVRFAGVELDCLVGSALAEDERYEPDSLDPPPKLVVATSSHLGGWAQPGGPFEAAPKVGPVQDSYGAGDCFAAGLTFGLARGDEYRDAIALAARCGATVVTGKGPYGRQLREEDLVV
jgi:ribokinase